MKKGSKVTSCVQPPASSPTQEQTGNFQNLIKTHWLKCFPLREPFQPVSCVRLLPLTQLVPVGQQDGGAVQDVGQRRLDQLPAGDALDGLGQGRGETVQLVLHQHPLEGLGVGRWGSQIEGGDKQTETEGDER